MSITLNHPSQGGTNWFSAVDGNWTTLESSVTTPKSILSWAATANNTNIGLSRWGRGDQSPPALGDITIAVIRSPFSGTLKNLYLDVATAPGSGTWTVTVRVNGANTNIIVTLSGSTVSSSDLTHSQSVSAGDKIDILVTNSGGPPVTNMACTLELDSS